MTSKNCHPIVEGGSCAFLRIKAEPATVFLSALAFGLVWPVAFVASVGKNRANFALEVGELRPF